MSRAEQVGGWGERRRQASKRGWLPAQPRPRSLSSTPTPPPLYPSRQPLALPHTHAHAQTSLVLVQPRHRMRGGGVGWGCGCGVTRGVCVCDGGVVNCAAAVAVPLTSYSPPSSPSPPCHRTQTHRPIRAQVRTHTCTHYKVRSGVRWWGGGRVRWLNRAGGVWWVVGVQF